MEIEMMIFPPSHLQSSNSWICTTRFRAMRNKAAASCLSAISAEEKRNVKYNHRRDVRME